MPTKAIRVASTRPSSRSLPEAILAPPPWGQSDYNATTHVAVPDDEGNFTIDGTAFAGSRGRVRLVRVNANGWARFSEDVGSNYTRDARGVVSLRPFDLTHQQTDANDGPDNAYMVPPIKPCPCGAH